MERSALRYGNAVYVDRRPGLGRCGLDHMFLPASAGHGRGSLCMTIRRHCGVHGGRGEIVWHVRGRIAGFLTSSCEHDNESNENVGRNEKRESACHMASPCLGRIQIQSQRRIVFLHECGLFAYLGGILDRSVFRLFPCGIDLLDFRSQAGLLLSCVGEIGLHLFQVGLEGGVPVGRPLQFFCGCLLQLFQLHIERISFFGEQFGLLCGLLLEGGKFLLKLHE